MKTKFVLASCLLLCAAGLNAALLTKSTPVHTQPDTSAPVLTYLPEGTDVIASVKATAPAPTGWMAVDIATPFDAYVANRDLTKSLDPKQGALYRIQPKPDAPSFGAYETGDSIEITGLKGKWTQVKVSKTLVAYIRTQSIAAATPVPSPVQAPTPKPASAPEAVPTPASPTQLTGSAAPVPISVQGGPDAALPRSYSGTFVSSRRPFAPRRPYDFQINDSAGIRFAYLDLSKLLLTDSLDKYLERPVSVYGLARNLPGTKDIVIEVESMQLR